jgi:hypothetical protein
LRCVPPPQKSPLLHQWGTFVLCINDIFSSNFSCVIVIRLLVTVFHLLLLRKVPGWQLRLLIVIVFPYYVVSYEKILPVGDLCSNLPKSWKVETQLKTFPYRLKK